MDWLDDTDCTTGEKIAILDMLAETTDNLRRKKEFEDEIFELIMLADD